ncbi:rRNA maturation RNase YbeY [Aquimarina sp. RZ0]|uniref:rRNA maturation RNase YbeY n=1 Tax=Aquimarina sp. RZ0 TaxID=2607730 RepID=UPI0011F336B8|nr:rRNA maturation RNase YbeY [Aquimarina sp. RZ0]KAA1247355.1 rRNA maturation RNase YbeY [Aquimarina sp. RZ0]
MINFFFEEVEVKIKEEQIASWIRSVIDSETKKEGEISFIFCTDDYLLKLNQQFLSHDTFTDIISFDNSMGNELHGEIYISVERVEENATVFNQEGQEELRRVIIHGVLHLCGYKDKTEEESSFMRVKENEKLAMFHVEHS